MSYVLKNRYKLPEIFALIEAKQERLTMIDLESLQLRQDIALLAEELLRRSVIKDVSEITDK
jgi:hypothetical protein